MNRYLYFGFGILSVFAFVTLIGLIFQTSVVAIDSNSMVDSNVDFNVLMDFNEPVTIIQDFNVVLDLNVVDSNVDENKPIIFGSSGSGGGGSSYGASPPQQPVISEPLLDINRGELVFNNSSTFVDTNDTVCLKDIDSNHCFVFDGNNWEQQIILDENVLQDNNMSFNCVIEGDSLSSGYEGLSWWDHISDSNLSGCNLINFAVSGEKVSQMVSQYDSGAHLVEDKNLFFLWAGTNDIYSPDYNAFEQIKDLNLLWNMARDDNFLVVAFTLQFNGLLTGEQERERVLLNGFIRDENNYDFLVELDSVFFECGDWYLEEYCLHFNSGGYARVMQEISKVVK